MCVRGNVKLCLSIIIMFVMLAGGGRVDQASAVDNAATTSDESNNCWTLCLRRLSATGVSTLCS